MDVFSPPGVGWQRDLPDFRDYAPEHPEVDRILHRLRLSQSADWRRIPSVDLREFFPGASNQRNTNSSAAHACVALIEYFERRAHGRINPLSTLYVYKGARELLRTKCDDGVNLRTALKAIVRFGVPPEYRWPNREDNVQLEPDAFLHSYAYDYRPIVYLRLDKRNSTGRETLDRVRAFLAAGFPVAFGFPVPRSITSDSDIPYRPALDAYHGGQVVLATGYDDTRIRTSKGALLVRSSWGREWGDDGYGWLPYGYVDQQLATDFWTMLRVDWLASGDFHRPCLRKPRRRSSDVAHPVTRK
jgi:C1A family cysteine protease